MWSSAAFYSYFIWARIFFQKEICLVLPTCVRVRSSCQCQLNCQTAELVGRICFKNGCLCRKNWVVLDCLFSLTELGLPFKMSRFEKQICFTFFSCRSRGFNGSKHLQSVLLCRWQNNYFIDKIRKEGWLPYERGGGGGGAACLT